MESKRGLVHTHTHAPRKADDANLLLYFLPLSNVLSDACILVLKDNFESALVFVFDVFSDRIARLHADGATRRDATRLKCTHG